MLSARNLIALEELGVLRARGSDTVSFLQGQLSNDLARLSAERSLLAGYHNPQGRVIAVLRLVQLAADDLLAILPRELVVPVAQRLAKFVLRSKVKLADESALWAVAGLAGTAPPGPALPGTADMDSPALPLQADRAVLVDGASVVRLAGEPPRWLVVTPAAQRVALDSSPAQQAHWRQLAVAAGEAQVYASTSEEFVAQMLNLDVLGAIAFDKGCYTGQEVIARAHYRGRVKRRMQRFRSVGAARLEAADSGVLTDGRRFRVVRAAQHADGRCEFLAVTVVPASESAPPAERAATAAEAAASLETQQLALPYTLPD